MISCAYLSTKPRGDTRSGNIDLIILRLSVRGRCVANLTLRSLYRGERVAGTNRTGRYIGPRADLVYVKKRIISYPSRESNPEFLIFQPLA